MEHMNGAQEWKQKFKTWMENMNWIIGKARMKNKNEKQEWKTRMKNKINKLEWETRIGNKNEKPD